MSRQKLIHLWNDWQLSSLVLLSLFLQLLFLFTASLRRCMRPSKGSKAYFWGLYNISSPIAIYALGILSRASAGQADADIQAFWAALLLFHLGGVDDFTALSLEDNKLWFRRCFTLAVQAATTAYVFFHYFQDPVFRCFIVPFWFIFLAGIFKCLEQVLAQHQATMEALIGSVLGIPDPGPDYADTMDRVDGILRSGVLPSINNERVNRPNSDSPVTDEVEAEQNKDQQHSLRIIRSAHFLFSIFNVLFADGIFSFKDRQDSQAEFLNRDVHWAFRVVEIELSFVYDRLYTKASVSRTMSGLLIRIASLLLTLAGSLWALFITLGGSPYRLRNRCVTYTLLAGAVITEVVTLASHGFSIWSLVHTGWLEWCSDILLNGLAGHPLNRGARGKPLGQLPVAIVGRIFARELRAGLLSLKRPLSQKLLIRSFWSKYKHTRHVPVSEKLVAFIFDEIREKEKHFNVSEGKRQRKPGEVLDNHNPFTAYRGTYSSKDMARELSNYLFYIMAVHPLMLSPPATMAIKSEGAVSEENAHKFLLKVETPLPASVVKGGQEQVGAVGRVLPRQGARPDHAG
ncbi:hypothetical protein BAE44_0005433 [Dichanthelium oligosanthes]|uniref:DUF4220 domain-containing protein n=1 Tax=Dichanthelium oligosanthes TaxID=888268 RepID=A0A1E5W7Z9_9POAL|nr:hypothetical protein BAE44_0005433 [Dichanthelium oligosanthes]